jgi:outer membrane protein assembly factor BamA
VGLGPSSRFLIGIFLLLGAQSALPSPQDSLVIPASLPVDGLSFFSTTDLHRTLQIGSKTTESEWNLRLQTLAGNAASQGFLAFECEATMAEGGRIEHLQIMEGPRAHMGELQIDEWPESLTLPLAWHGGAPLTDEALANSFAELLNTLDHDGRPFALLRILELQWRSDDNKLWLDLHCRLEHADPEVIDAVHFPGELLSRPQTLLRLSHLKPGQLYDPDRLRDARRRLLSRDWFHEVQEPALCRCPEGTGLLVVVKEKPAYHFDGNLAYLPPNQNDDKGRLAYRFLLDLDNLLGTGRELHIEASRPDGLSQDLSLAYREPFIGGLPVGLGLAIDQDIQDSSWVRRQLEFALDVEPVGGVILTTALRFREILPDSLNGFLRLGIDHSVSRSFSAGVTVDRRDNPLNPRRGSWASLAIENQNRESRDFRGLSSLLPDLQIRRQEAHLKGWFPLYKQWVAFAHLGLGRLDGDEAPLEEQFELGGTMGPRAYRDASLRGQEWWLLQAEARFLLGPASRLAIFWDTLWLNPETDLQRYHGRGAAFLLPAGQQVLEFQYALAPGRAFRQGYIHLRWIARF